MVPPAGRPPALTHEQIADAAIAVGFKDVTMGKVAAELGVDYTTLYRYVPHRDGLVALGLDRLVRLDGITLYDAGDELLTWRELLERAAHRIWDFLGRHPDVATEMAKVILPPRVFELASTAAARLTWRSPPRSRWWPCWPSSRLARRSRITATARRTKSAERPPSTSSATGTVLASQD